MASNPGLLPDGSLRADYQRRLYDNQNRSLPPSAPFPSPPHPYYHPSPHPPPPHQQPYAAPQPYPYPYPYPTPQPQHLQQHPSPTTTSLYNPQHPSHPLPQQPPPQQPLPQQPTPQQPTPQPYNPYPHERASRLPQPRPSAAAPGTGTYYSDPNRPVMSSFRASGRRRALLVGINYVGTRNQLRGCVRDVSYVHHLLKTKFGFRDRDFYVLTDEDPRIPNVARGRPDRRTIIKSLEWLVGGSRPGDSLWFSFSGHGSQVVDTNGDESDGYDETLLPVDYKVAGPIVDDELYTIVRRVSRGSRLTVLLDACHSGTGLDLPYQHDLYGTGTGQRLSSGGRPLSIASGVMNVANHIFSGNPAAAVQAGINLANRKKKRPAPGPDANSGEVLLFAGCKDNQTAADTPEFTRGLPAGAMTAAFIETIEHSTVGDWRNYNYRKLLQTMREKLRAKRMQQTPQFSTSHPFDLHSPFVL